ncbi:MAG: DUF883 family protein [Natronohydrobacter sp.]|nr:DUF883 family protein [Natronohydrobacter sp.]
MARQPLKKATETETSDADDSANNALSDVLEHLETLRTDLSELASRVADLGDESIRAGQDKLRRESDRAMRTASRVLNDVADQSEDVIAQADRFSRERPALAMGIAAAAGFVLALTISRR